MISEATGTTYTEKKEEILVRLLNLSKEAATAASATATASKKRNSRTPTGTLVGLRSSKRVRREEPDPPPTHSIKLAKAVQKMAVMAASSRLTPIMSMNWHDVMIENLLNRGDLAAQDI